MQDNGFPENSGAFSHSSHSTGASGAKTQGVAFLDESLYLAMSKAITHDALEKLESKTARTRNISIALITLAFTVVTALGGVLGNAVISERVSDQFDELRTEQLSDMLFMRDVETLALLLSQIEPGDNETDDQLLDVQSQLEHIEQTYFGDEVHGPQRRREAFARLSVGRDQVFDAFARGGAPGELVRLTASMKDFVSLSGIDVSIGAQALGREFIGAIGGAAAWKQEEGQPTNEYVEAFEIYLSMMSRARQNGYPELRLLFETIRHHMQGADPLEINGLIDEVDNLNDRDAAIFHDLFTDFLTEEWRSSPDSFSGRVKSRAIAFLRDYARESDRLAAIVQEGNNSGIPGLPADL